MYLGSCTWYVHHVESFLILGQADHCRLQKQKNHAVEEMARHNRIRIYHELAAARKNGVAQVKTAFSLIFSLGHP